MNYEFLIMHLTPEDKLLLSAVSLHPTGEELERMNQLLAQVKDWDYLMQNSIDRAISTLLLKKLPLLSNASLVPPLVKTKLQQAYYVTLSRSMLLLDMFAKIATVFTANNIELIALKGIYLGEWLYGDIALRQMSDIDVLVRATDGEHCLALLTEMGFRPRKENPVSEFIHSKSDFVHYAPMELNDISVEIHIKLHRASESYSLKLDKVWSASLPVTINKVAVRSLSLYDLLIHLCIHLDKHFKEGHVQFTCFSDITNILSKYADSIDWKGFEDLCIEYKCEEIVFKYLVLVTNYFNAPLPKQLLQRYNSLLLNTDKDLFIQYLHGFKIIENEDKSKVPEHLNNLKQLDKLSDRVKYFFDLAFPPKDFMLEKYKSQFIIHNSQFIKKEKDDQFIIHNSQFINEMKKLDNKKLCIMHSKLLIKYWWLLYPYRWWVGLKGFVKLIIHK